MKTRNLNIEALRIISCLFVISIHSTYNYDPSSIKDFNNISGLLVHSIVRAGLPIFFIISGYYLLNRKIDNIWLFYKKRGLRTIVPFLIYSLIHLLVFNRENLSNLSFYNDYLIKLLNGSLSVHFWFVYAIIGIYLITPAISLVFCNLCIKSVNLVFVIILTSYLLNLYLAQMSMPSLQSLQLPYFNHWYLYFIIGGVIGKNNFIISMKVVVPIIISAYILTVFLIARKNSLPGMMPFDGGLNMIILSSCIFMLFTKCNIEIKKHGATLTHLSEATYGIYLVHMCVMNLIYKNFITSNILYNSIMMTIFTFLISLAVTYVIDRVVIKKSLLILRA